MQPSRSLQKAREYPPDWKISERGKQIISDATSLRLTRHGVLASVPILCKGKDCPYAEVCYLVIDNTVPDVGERCPLEVVAIIDRFEMYVRQLNIDLENIVDLNLIKNVIDVEIQICRADKKLAINGDIVEMVIAAISPRGEAFYKPEISKAAEYKLKLMDVHAKLLSMLYATRKDKAASKINITIDASNYASQLLKRSNMNEVIDVGTYTS